MVFQKFDRLWKVWLVVPFALLMVSTIIILNTSISTGFFVGRDVELTGGNRVTVELVGSVDVSALQSALPYAKIQLITGLRNELLIEASPDVDVGLVVDDLTNFGVAGDYDIKTVGPVLGDIFWRQAQLAILVAFILMSIVIFVLFRTFVSSAIVIFSIVTDVIITISVMNLVGINLSLPVLAGLLMIIGYTVDTNILLTSETLKVRGRHISESIKTAMKTGLTMSFTTLGALIVLYLVSGNFVIGQIALVLMIGILADIIVTWFGNANILRIWLMRHEVQ